MKETPELIPLLREAFNYDPETGIVTYARARQNANAGARAGHRHKLGYRVLNFRKTLHREHRVIFAMMTGRWPEHEIDHKNNRGDDNRWENLREATATQNKANSVYKNASGFKGAYRKGEKWESLISRGGKLEYLGRFDTPEAAHAAYKAAATEEFGEFARFDRAYLD